MRKEWGPQSAGPGGSAVGDSLSYKTGGGGKPPTPTAETVVRKKNLEIVHETLIYGVLASTNSSLGRRGVPLCACV